MTYVLRPVKQPPTLGEYSNLSSEIQRTMVALEKKYTSLQNQLQDPLFQKGDPVKYYKSVYNAPFRRSTNARCSRTRQYGRESHIEPDSENFVEHSFKVSAEHAREFNRRPSGGWSCCELRDNTIRKKGSRVEPVTEVLLNYRPSDEEIAKNVLLLTQRTSSPNSPCMDLDEEVLDNHPLNGCTYNQSSDGVGSIPQCTHVSTETGTPKRLEKLFTHNLAKNGEEHNMLHNRDRFTPLMDSFKKRDADRNADLVLLTGQENVKSSNQSLVLFNSVSQNLVTDVESSSVHGGEQDKSTNNNEESLKTDNRYYQSVGLLKAIEVANFELKLSDFELSQLSHDSVTEINSSQKHKEDECLLERDSPKSSFRENDLQLENRETVSWNNCNAHELSENPLEKWIPDSENVTVGKEISKKCGKNLVREALKLSRVRSSCAGESPYIEDIGQTEQLRSNTESATGLSRNKVPGHIKQLKIDTLFQIRKFKRKENLCKDSVEVHKRSSAQNGNPCVKKIKTSFKPPFKIRTDVISETQKETLLDPSPELINFSCLSLEKQQETCSLLESYKFLTLALLYDTDVTSATSFYSAAGHAKKKNSPVQSHTVGTVLMGEKNNTSKCFLVPTHLMCRDDIKRTLLNIMLSGRITKFISNCKEFLIGIQNLCSLDSQHGLACDSIEDPVIACWLVEPEVQPSSFKQMCQTAHIQYNAHEDDWSSCLKLVPKLMHAFRDKLKADKLWPIFTEIEMKLVPILACMESHVIRVDTELFVRFSHVLKSKLDKLKEAVYKEAGYKFSLNSHAQLRQVLYEELKLDQKLAPHTKVGKTDVSNQKSTCEASLHLLAAVHPLPALVLEYRQLQKLMSTYVEGMMSCVVSGSITTHWDQTAAATGRLTSSQPNIQAIPKAVITVTDFQASYVIGSKKMLDAKINAREPFISSSGYVLLAADFQQIELRMLAHLSGDSSLQELFRKVDGDVFLSLTKQRLNKTREELTLEDREQTKTIVYSVMYGVGKDKLSEYLKVEPDIAKDIINSFLSQFPAINSFTRKCWGYAEKFGYTETVSGRRRYFPHINHASPVIRAQARRQAVNFCVQGSAADVCKLAMLAVEDKLRERSHLSCRLLLQIHDELIWEVAEDKLIEAKGIIQQVMEDTGAMCGTLFSLHVPLTVALASGKSWAHMTPFT